MVLSIGKLFGKSGSYSLEVDETQGETEVHTASTEDWKWPEFMAGLVVSLFMLPAGISLGYSSILIPQLEAKRSDLKINNVESSYIASCVPLATPIGDVLVGFIINKVGRINTLRLGVVPHLMGWTCIALATNVPLMIVGRALTGFSAAFSGGSSSAYVAEVVQPIIRGSMLTLGMVFYSLGYLLVYVVGAIVPWRTVAWVSMPLCLIPLILMSFFCTESPVWLASRGRDEDAFKSLAFLTRTSKQPDKIKHNFVTEIKIQRGNQHYECKSSLMGFIRGLLKQYKPVLLTMLMLVLQEFSGTYILVFYTVSIFQGLGATIDPYWCTVGNGVLGVVLGASSSLMMKYFGRRSLLLFSSIGMALAMLISGFLKMEVDNGTMAPNLSPVICLLLFTIFNGCGMLNIPWMLATELIPMEMKGLTGMIFASSTVFMFAAIEVYPFLSDALGGLDRVLLMFAGVSLAAAIFVFVFLPETHNKPMREVQEYFQHNTFYTCRRKPPWTSSVDDT